MPEDTKLKTCANCTVWTTEFRLANKVTSCAALGFSAEDSCEKWTDEDPTRIVAFIRIPEPSLSDIMSNKEIRAPWKAFKEKISSTTAHYNNGFYYYFFDEDTVSEADRFASSLSKEEYLQTIEEVVFPIHLANLEEDDQASFKKLAKVDQEK